MARSLRALLPLFLALSCTDAREDERPVFARPVEELEDENTPVEVEPAAPVETQETGTTETVPPETPLAPEQPGEGASSYCERVAPFFCDFYVRCGRMAAQTAEACRPMFLETCNARFEPRYRMLESAQLLSLSTEGIDACRQRLEAVSCDAQPFDLVGECAQMWEGHQAPGGPCGMDVESLVCPTGTACRLDLTFCGRCEPAAPIGGECGPDTLCAPDAQCIDGHCAARGLPGDRCGAERSCLAGLRCTGDVCQAPALAALGEVCGAGRRCVYNSACVAGVCKLSVKLGERCDSQTACASGICIQRGDVATCEPLKVEGDRCEAPSECESANCVEGFCRVIPGACFNVEPT